MNWRTSKDLWDTINDCGDMGFAGPTYIWSNNRAGAAKN